MFKRVLPFLLLLSFSASAQERDKTTSPYFFVSGDSAAAMPLLATSADVSIAGMIADVTVKQIYRNNGKKPIEAVYIFPGSTRAAVYAMKMKVGKRSITAKIKEKGQARQEYDAAKAAGKTASLLEQLRPNIFRMNVSNILPDDSITVELAYTETIVPEEGVYEFVYPTVVGPRYNSPGDLDPVASLDAQPPQHPANVIGVPTQHEKELPLYTFGMRVGIAAGMPVKEITSPSHKIQLSFETAGEATVLLDPEEKQGGNRDFVLRYRLAGNTVQNGLLTYRENGENFFLFTMQPPKRVPVDSVPGREYIFIMDVSGSMDGFPIATSKKLLRDLIGSLRKNDRFNLVLFAGYANILSKKSLPATSSNIEKAIRLCSGQEGSGGTELKSALDRAMALPRYENYARSIVLCTDGYIGNEAAVFESIRNNVGNTSVFSFGIGTSVNRFLIEGLAHCGSGEPFVVLNENEAPAIAEKFRTYVSSPVLTQVKVDFGNMDVYDVEPRFVPDLFAEKPIVICGKYKGSTEGSIRVSGMNGKRSYSETISTQNCRPRNSNRALRYLWARKRIQLLDDYGELSDSAGLRTKEVTRLGLEYNLLTKYTSFIAVYDKVRNKNGEDSTVVVPVPLPQNVSDKSIASVAVTTGGIPAMYGSVSGGVLNLQECVVESYCMPLTDHSFSSCIRTANFNASHFLSLGLQEKLYSDFYSGNYFQPPAFVNNEVYTGSSITDRAVCRVYPAAWLNTLNYYFVGAKTNNSYDAGAEYKEVFPLRKSAGADISLSASQQGCFTTDVVAGHSFKDRLSASLLLHADRSAFFIDRSHDGFADIPRGNNFLVSNAWRYKNDEYPTSPHTFYENTSGFFAAHLDQLAGQKAFDPKVNDTSVYGIRQLTRSAGVFHTTSARYTNGNRLLLNVRALASDVDDRAGDNHYNGREVRQRTELTFAPKNEKWQQQYGVVFTAAQLYETLNDSSGQRTEYVPGAFVRLSRTDIRNLQLSGGMRVDYHNLYGLMYTPQFKLHYDYSDRFALIAIAGGNNRLVNPIADNLQLLQNARTVSVTEKLRPESSYTYGGGYVYSFYLRHRLYVSTELYRTDFLNTVVVDRESSSDRITITNLHGEAHINLLMASVKYSFGERFSFSVNYLYRDKQLSYEGRKLSEAFSPKNRFIAILGYQLPGRGNNYYNAWGFGVSASAFGRQRLPLSGGSVQAYAPAYAVLNVQVEKSISNRWSFGLLAENVLDYRMQHPVLSADQPFGENFDASQQWGPVAGIALKLGVTWKINKN